MANSTRSKTPALVPDGYQQPPIRQPPVSAPLSTLLPPSHLAGLTAVLDQVQAMADNLVPTTPVEKGLRDIMNLIISQVKEMKVEQARIQQEVFFRHKKVVDDIDNLNLAAAKTEQYTRRDTLTVVGLPMPAEPESHSELSTKVAEVLSVSGEPVTAADFTAIHRNSQAGRVVKGRNIPPSVTVRFQNINKKDNVLRQYKNFDLARKKPKEIKVYQSLSKHYSDVRKKYLISFMLM